MHEPKSSVHALNLPEIAHHVARYLDAKDVVVCSEVSRSLHNSMYPLVWQDLHFGRPCKINRDQTPFARSLSIIPCEVDMEPHHRERMEFMLRQAQWTRSLTIHHHGSTSALQLGVACARLESLAIHGLTFKGRSSDGPEYWDACHAMFERHHPTLQHLSLVNWTLFRVRKVDHEQPLWNPVLTCATSTKLRSLRLAQCCVLGRYMRPFWTICERLEVLELDDVDFELSWPRPRFKPDIRIDERRKPAPQSTASVRFPRLQELKLSNMKWKSAHRQLNHLIRQCPILRTLEWDIQRKAAPVDLLCDLLEVDTWPRLESIFISSNTNIVKDDQYCDLLKACRRPLRRFDIRREPMGDATFEVLRVFQSAAIEMIDLSDGPKDTSVITVEILTSFPALRILKARTVRARDIIDNDRSWVCLGLQELVVFIDMEFPDDANNRRFTKEEIEQCRSVFVWISALRELRVLDMLSPLNVKHVVSDVPVTDPRHWRNRMVPLPLRLQAGLDLLDTLLKLKTVAFYGGKHEVHMKDLEWITKHWRSLKNLQGWWWIRRGTANTARHKYLWSGYQKFWLDIRGISSGGSGFDEFSDNVNTITDVWSSESEEQTN